MLEAMHRIIIYIDDELDIRAQREARRRNISRAALIRQSLVTELGPTTRQDLLDELIGLSDAEPVNDLDSIVYGA
ncbi:MAG: ribbon-helix-helix domain-containing protein [Actinomycetota bacterium]|jgi:predicted transcriptional regulator|nr:ribbon-helix-helix domain-containing protein [Actinomycetota bacterium]